MDSAGQQASRLAVLLTALDPEAPIPSNRRARILAVGALLVEGEPDRVWLTLSVLRAELPTRELVVDTRRLLAREPSEVVISQILSSVRFVGGMRPVPTVSVVTGVTVVDVHHTARTRLATGIQRVVRKSLQVWDARHEITMVGWSTDYSALRRLSPDEIENALHGSMAHSPTKFAREVTVPWKSLYLLPELAIESERTSRIAALAEFSGNRTTVIGYDCVPLTTAETTSPGMAAAFARNLAAVADFDRVATISAAAACEYSGWRSMLPSIGKVGPLIREILLAAEPEQVSDAALAAAKDILIVDELPMLLCVGSHEPRKNHLSVLHAAEVLWSAGRKFSLTFVGGNSWGADEFKDMLTRLQSEGLPVQSISAISDDLLWSGYQLATCTVFPSLNEGFGLPVAESLSVGTPVVTSGFGSMAEIAEEGGAVLIDPRDDKDVVRGIELALCDPGAQSVLRTQAAARSHRSWAEYASELWDFAHEPDERTQPALPLT